MPNVAHAAPADTPPTILPPPAASETRGKKARQTANRRAREALALAQLVASGIVPIDVLRDMRRMGLAPALEVSEPTSTKTEPCPPPEPEHDASCCSGRFFHANECPVAQRYFASESEAAE